MRVKITVAIAIALAAAGLKSLNSANERDASAHSSNTQAPSAWSQQESPAPSP